MKKYKIILLFVFFSNHVFAQLSAGDSALVQNSNFKNQQFEYKRNIRFLDFKSKNVFVKYNPVSLTLGSVLFGYQKIISPQLSTTCLYAISCSEFSGIAIRRYGLLKGVLLTSDRLTRCTPLAIHDLNETVDLDKKTHKIIDDIELYK